MNMGNFLKTKRSLVAFLSIIGALCVAAIVVLCVLYFREKKYNDELKDTILLNESREMAFHGEVMLREGMLTDAEKLALSILPENLQDPDRPYCVDAERLLRNCHMHRNLSAFDLDVDDDYIVALDNEYAYGRCFRYNLASGQKEQICPVNAYPTYLSPDCSVIIYQLDSVVCVSNIQTGESGPLYELQNESLYDCKFDQTGGRAVISVYSDHLSSESYRSLYIYDVASGEFVDLDVRDAEGRDRMEVAYAFSNDGRWMTETYVERDQDWEPYTLIQLWDMADYSWKSSYTASGQKQYYYLDGADVYSADDSLFVCGTAVHDGKIQLIDMYGEVCCAAVEPVSGDVAMIQDLGEDGNVLFVYDRNGCYQTLTPIMSAEQCFYVNEDVICTCDNENLCFYDASSLEEIMSFTPRFVFNKPLMSPDGTKLVLCNHNYGYKMFDLSSIIVMGAHVVASSDKYIVLSNGQVRSADDFDLIMTVPASEIVSLADDFLAVADSFADENIIQVFDIRKRKLAVSRELDIVLSGEGCIEMSPSGRHLSCCSYDSESQIIDLYTGAILFSTEEWSDLDFSEDGAYIYGFIWADSHSGSVMLTPLQNPTDEGWQDYSGYRIPVSNKARFWIDYDDGAIVNLTTGERTDIGIETYPDSYHVIKDRFEFSPSDDLFLIYDDDYIKVYETDTWTLVFERNDLRIVWADLENDGYLSVCSYAGEDRYDECVSVYDTDDWKKVHEFRESCNRDQFPYMPYMIGKEDFYIYDVCDLNDSTVAVLCSADPDYLHKPQFYLWSKDAAGFVASYDIPDLDPHFGEDVIMTDNGDLILSSFGCVKKITMPDLQTLIDQGRERYGL